MRTQYKVLAEKYHIICEAEDVTLGKHGLFENFVYEESVYNLILDIKDWSHAKEFIDWLVNKSDLYSTDITDFASENGIKSAIEAACGYFDNVAENYAAGHHAWGSDQGEETAETYARYKTSEIIKHLYILFLKVWWPKEQARQAALNRDNPGIEMDI